jgi:hypothetical protein
MGNRFLFIGSALLPALLFACSAAGSGTTTPTGTPTDLASSLATEFCAVQATCSGTTGPTPDAAVTGATDAATTSTAGAASTCLERATLAATQQLALVNTAFGEGLLALNATVEASCTGTYQSTLTCATMGSVPDVQAALDQPACGGLFIGYIPVGERCDMSAECVSGSFCRSQGTGQPATAIAGSGTLGVCFAYVPMSGACNTTDDCLPPFVCNPTALVCD